jgi:hypothetical protein
MGERFRMRENGLTGENRVKRYRKNFHIRGRR